MVEGWVQRNRVAEGHRSAYTNNIIENMSRKGGQWRETVLSTPPPKGERGPGLHGVGFLFGSPSPWPPSGSSSGGGKRRARWDKGDQKAQGDLMLPPGKKYRQNCPVEMEVELRPTAVGLQPTVASL